jgi:hypothetical protein
MTTTEAPNLSTLVAACESAWRDIQAENPDVGDAIIVIGSGGRRANTLLGHFAVGSWTQISGEESIHEVLLVAEQLHRPAHEVFTTLLHEAVHGIATTRGIKDTAGRRHNKKFAALCEEIGLCPPAEPHSTLGYSAATLYDSTARVYADTIASLEGALKVIRKLNLETKTTRKTTWMAKCECDRSVRIPKKTIDDPQNLNIQCGDCTSYFEMTEEDLDDYVEQQQGDKND